MSAPLIFVRNLCRNRHARIYLPVRSCSFITKEKSHSSYTGNGFPNRIQRRKKAIENNQEICKVRTGCKRDGNLSQGTKYFIENGLRKVYPYYYTFGSYVKERWIGKTILDIYNSDFRNVDLNPVDLAERGSITVDGEAVSLDFVLGTNMRVELYTHRHELPVLDVPIEIIADTDELLVINKPASIPVHPCGRYRYNSVTMLLKHELGYDDLRPMHRLDRLASGLLIFLKPTPAATKFVQQLHGQELYKEYVCRVEGKFPDGEVVCSEPIGPSPKRLILNKVDPSGKPSLTTFTRLSYNGKTSVVKCVPHTGRTHQIRVHLQFLGYPISNDYVYKTVAMELAKDKTLEEIEATLIERIEPGRVRNGDNPRYYQKFGEKRSSKHPGNLKGCIEDEKTTNELCVHGSGYGINAINETVEKVNRNQENGVGDLENTVGDLEKKTEVFDHSSARSEMNSFVKSGRDVFIQQRDESKMSKESVSIGDFHNSSIDTNCFQDNCDVSKSELERSALENNPVSVANFSSEFSSELSSELEKTSGTSTAVDNCELNSGRTDVIRNVTDRVVDESKVTVVETCEECKFVYKDPEPGDLYIYLHAVRYQGPDWEFRTSLPYWASEDFDEQQNTQRACS